MKVGNQYPDDFKKRVVLEYLDSQKSVRYFSLQYNIRGKGTIAKWISNFAPEIREEKMKKRLEKSELELLQMEVSRLSQELELAQLKSLGFETMIKIAEEELKIPIRKKFGVKRYKK
jgi:transposase-like protein